MTRILRDVLGADELIQVAKDSYIDNVIVQDELISADAVVHHLKRYGL